MKINNITHTKCPFFSQKKEEKQRKRCNLWQGGREREKKTKRELYSLLLSVCFSVMLIWATDPLPFSLFWLKALTKKPNSVWVWERQRESGICVLTELWRFKVCAEMRESLVWLWGFRIGQNLCTQLLFQFYF